MNTALTYLLILVGSATSGGQTATTSVTIDNFETKQECEAILTSLENQLVYAGYTIDFAECKVEEAGA